MAAISVMWHKPFVITFIPTPHGGSKWNLVSIGIGVSNEKKFENVESEWPWTWPKINCFTFFPYKSIREQIWPCHKVGQGQPRVIIWTNLVVLEHLMLHTKFQGHLPFGSGEDFKFFLPYMGMAAILVMWPGPFEQTFVPPSHRSSIWNLTLIGLASMDQISNHGHVLSKELSNLKKLPQIRHLKFC